MVVPKEKPVTVEVFEEFVARTENHDRLFELIEGEMVEVSPGRTRNSEIGQLISFAVQWFCREHNLSCHVSAGDGAYRIGSHVIAPDFAYKRTPTSDEYPDPVPPELAVEIISPTDKADDIRKKRSIYRQANILLWEVYPSTKNVDVYEPGQPVQELDSDGLLDGDDVLPGFTLKVADIFPKG